MRLEPRVRLRPEAQAVLLLNVSFGKSDTGDGKPLSKQEWARFAVWLNDNGLEPSVLLKGDLDALLKDWEDRRITLERLRALLNRGAALGLSLERWQRAGLWVLTRSDPDYPERLKRRLGAAAPAVIFGCGNKSLLGRGGIAVVGSRNAGEDDLAFARNLAADAAGRGYSIVSGGARGVDRNAMQGALEREGTAVGVLADSLLRSAMAAGYRQYILSGDLALVSPFNPEARFNVGNAMARNACIYCLADAAVVVTSEAGKGGTWNGAVEDLEIRWVPLWVKPDSAPGSGNPELVRRGAAWLPTEARQLWRPDGRRASGRPPVSGSTGAWNAGGSRAPAVRGAVSAGGWRSLRTLPHPHRRTYDGEADRRPTHRRMPPLEEAASGRLAETRGLRRPGRKRRAPRTIQRAPMRGPQPGRRRFLRALPRLCDQLPGCGRSQAQAAKGHRRRASIEGKPSGGLAETRRGRGPE